MTNELTPVPYNITNIRDNHENNINITGSTVNFHIQPPQNANPSAAQDMIAVQRFSKEYYHLIVTTQEDAFRTNTILVLDSRCLIKGCVPDEIFNECSTLTEAGINKLLTFPAIVCMESKEPYGKPDPTQYALYAYIKKIKKVGGAVAVVFQPLGAFPQDKLYDKRNSVFFDLNMNCYVSDLNHSSWSVHKVNVFEAFSEAGITHLPTPMI